ncbi:MAG: RND transporter [Legionellales bacterium]|nr:RND transporter [Legionellales bacterium]
MKILRTLLVSLCCFGISSCAVGPDFHAPATPPTNQYTQTKQPTKTMATTGAKNAANAQQFNLQQDIPANWWVIFHSKQINQLVEQGLKNSPNLKAAKATLSQAQASLQAQIGELLFPSVDFAGDAKRLRTSTISFGEEDENSIFNLYGTTFNVSYNLDVFGKSRRTIEGYQAEVDYEQYELAGSYLSLSTNIVTTSIAIASLQDQISATKQLIRAQTNTLSITKKQYRLGGISKEDVLLQETTLAQTQASLPPLKKALAETTHSLAVLTGKYTSQQSIPRITLAQFNLPKNLPLSLPSKLVQQRPDIKASEALLHQANAAVGVATADLFPQFTITGDFGYLAQQTKDFFSHANNVWNIGLGLTQPVFHGGALLSERQAVMDAYKTSVAHYQETVLEAFENVANALSAIQMDAIEYNRQFAANQAAMQTMQLTEKQYRLGGVDYLTVLNAQEKYQETKLALIKAQAARYSDTAALYQALGGGWWHAELNTQNLNGEKS